MTTLRVGRSAMAKPQLVAAVVALQRLGKREGRERLSARRAIPVAVCQHRSVRPRHIAFSIGAAALSGWALQCAPLPSAQAEPCPDAEVVFARGTTESPGVGPTGEAFVDALRARVAPKSLGVYAVDYPATIEFSTAVDGINDARAHVLATAANCPKTKIVLGGFSQGAAVAGFV